MRFIHADSVVAVASRRGHAVLVFDLDKVKELVRRSAAELAAAAVARGIDRPGRKTSYNAPRFGRVDFLSLAFLVICCSLLVAVKVNQGIGGLL